MQTVNEIAKRYANKCPHGVWRDDAELAFLDGVYFAQRWIPVEEVKPPSREMILVKIDRDEGKTWILLAEFIPAKTVYAEDFFEDYDEDDMDYDEDEDMYYVPETWVECSYFGISHMFSEKVIEWRPIEYPLL